MRYAGLIAFCWFSIVGSAAPRTDRPNIILLTADCITFERLGCYGGKGSWFPSIDRLGNGGARFDNFYLQPGDTVAAVSLLSGRYPFRHGWMWHNDAEKWGEPTLSPDREFSVARVLALRGYRTAIVGRWLLNDLTKEPNALTEHGFQRACIWTGDRQLRTDQPPYWNPSIFEDGRQDVRKEVFAPDLLLDYALKFVRDHRREPFFLYFPIPMSADDFPVGSVHLAGGPPTRGVSRRVDAMVAQFVKLLDELDLDKETILLITREALEGRPQTLRETSIRAPLIVYGTYRVRRGVVKDLLDCTDLFPTLSELAGGRIPRDREIDGRSFAPQLRGAVGHPREWIFAQYGTDRILSNGRYKIYSNGRFYNLLSDPNEEHNLARANVSEAIAERERLQKLLRAMPPDNPLNFPYARRLRIRKR